MKFKVLVPRGQSDAFNAAVFHYLGLRRYTPLDEMVVVDSEPQGEFDLKSVDLWDDEAVNAFRLFWQGYSQPCPPYALACR